MKSSTPAHTGPSPVGTRYVCADCQHATPKWHGRCPTCRTWGSLVESGPLHRRPAPDGSRPPTAPAVRIDLVPTDRAVPRSTGLSELDRVLGGGLVPGAVVLLAGEPGVGKSTLLLSAAHAWAAGGAGRVLIVSGEESAGQVRLRAERLGSLHTDVFLAAETDLGAVLGHVDQVAPTLLIVDSVQTVSSAEAEGVTGGVSQVRAVASALTAVAKARDIACVLVGHVTKEGSIAGPRALEHLVDVVLHFEGDRHSALRLLRGVKNRFGPADEIGCFEMSADGITGLVDPSGLFLSGRAATTPGTCTTVGLHGRRALPVEVQALTYPTSSDNPRRTVSGLDSARTAMVLAVVQRWGGVRLTSHDVLTATVGGVRLTEPSADLALSLAVWSAARDSPLPAGVVAMGELGLSGALRPVVGVDRRLAEAGRLGFTHGLIPGVTGRVHRRGTMRITEVADLTDALLVAAEKHPAGQRRPG